MPGPDDAASLLERARRERDPLAVRLLLAAAVQRAGLEVGVQTVVTGGTAADFYASGTLGTSAGYPAKWRASADVDMVALSVGSWKPARRALLQRLEALGMRPRYVVADDARIVDVPELDYILELVGEELERDPRGERVVTVMLDGMIPLTLRGPEDVILAYAESGWHLRHTGDWTRALAVYAVMRDRLDVDRMRLEAQRRGQDDVLERVVRQEPLFTPRG